MGIKDQGKETFPRERFPSPGPYLPKQRGEEKKEKARLLRV